LDVEARLRWLALSAYWMHYILYREWLIQTARWHSCDARVVSTKFAPIDRNCNAHLHAYIIFINDRRIHFSFKKQNHCPILFFLLFLASYETVFLDVQKYFKHSFRSKCNRFKYTAGPIASDRIKVGTMGQQCRQFYIKLFYFFCFYNIDSESHLVTVTATADRYI
jgi:hypothetical protein